MWTSDMDQANAHLLRIGLFSKLSSISVRMLRHYQSNGILIPAAVDPFTGHRYYEAGQLVTAHWVVLLRDAGLPVAEIAQAMRHADDPAELRRILAQHRQRIEREHERLAGISKALDRIDSHLERSTMTTDIRIQEFPTMTVASLRRVLPSYQDEGQLWQELSECLSAADLEMPGHASLGGATFWDSEHRETDVDVEVWVQVPEPFPSAGPLTCREMPACRAVVGTLHGSYDGMPEVTLAIGAYLGAHQLETGPMFNIYRVSPAQDPNPANWVTDVCFPITG
ncbi:MerR family transcriptional regulator [Tessaracoccus sp. OH4464_COT-324]|nr:MerR family transcriptional regulator [Tessaracoccus sp. OH4464_COT-324]